MEIKNVITLKKQIPFIEQCMSRFGYITRKTDKVDRNWMISFERSHAVRSERDAARQAETERRLRNIEIITRKKCNYTKLFINVLIQAAILCIQSLIFHGMGMENVHPGIMLAAGVVMLNVILIGTLAFKCIEVFKWDRTINAMKAEILENNFEEIKKPVENGERIVSVLFTRGHDFISNMLYWVTGRQYTHASLGFGEQTDEFFSFDYRGMRREHPGHRKVNKNHRDSLCYQFIVPENEYMDAERNIRKYLQEQNKFSYNTIGAAFCILHIYMPLKRKKSYFCSEFVSEQLKSMESFGLGKTANMYLPSSLAKKLIRQKNLYRVLVDEI